MIKITQRPIFEFEKQEYLKTLLPVRERLSFKLVWTYVAPCYFLTVLSLSLVSRMLQAVLSITKAAAMIAGLVFAFCGSVYICFRLKRRGLDFYEKERARLDASVIETFEMDILRAWQLDDCSCCSTAYLLQASDTEFAYVEAESQTDTELNEFPTRRLTIERDRDTKAIWRMRSEGPLVAVEELEEFLAEDLPAYGTSEFKILKLDELPEPLRAKVAAL